MPIGYRTEADTFGDGATRLGFDSPTFRLKNFLAIRLINADILGRCQPRSRPCRYRFERQALRVELGAFYLVAGESERAILGA